MDGIIRQINALNFINFISVLLGLVVIHSILWQGALGHLSPDGLTSYIDDLIQSNTAPQKWNYLLSMISAYHFTFTLGIACIMLITAIGLLFLFHPIFPAFTACLYVCFWMSHLGIKGNWLFELLFPALFAVCVFLGQIEFYTSDIKTSYYGVRLFNTGVPKYNKLCVFAFALVLFYFSVLSKNGAIYNLTVSSIMAMITAMVLLLTIHLDTNRVSADDEHLSITNENYLTLMAMIIGLMLIYQVNADIAFHWFSTDGYKSLVNSYYKHTNAPELVRKFLMFSSDNAEYFAKVQYVFESCAAVCLYLSIFRLPLYWLTTGLLAALAIIEFGIPATWPPLPNSPTNWLWELLLPTMVLLLCSISETARFIRTVSSRHRWLGKPLLPNLSVFSRHSVAVLLFGHLLMLIAMQSVADDLQGHIINKSIHISLLLTIILVLCDPLRK